MHIPFTRLGLLALLATTSNGAEPQSEPSWFRLNKVGFHHHGEGAVKALSESEAINTFTNQHPRLSKTFVDTKLPRLKKAATLYQVDPERNIPPRDPRCFAEVSQFNDRHVHVKILQPLGGWRWHHHFQILAHYSLSRSPAVDALFGLDALHQKMGFTYKGIAHGMPSPGYGGASNIVHKTLGPPDYTFLSQSPLLGRYYYEKHDLHITTHHYRIYTLERGKPQWTQYQKPDSERRRP